MIVDNVDDPAVIFNSTGNEETSAPSLQSCIPDVNGGCVLFTTRWKGVAQKITKKNHIQVNEMTAQDAKNLLKENLSDGFEESSDLEDLLDELGHIPMAISHAAAFMNQNFMSVSDYLETYQAGENDRLALLRPTLEEIGISDPNEFSPKEDYPVLKTWLVSFNHVKANPHTGPLASEILSVMSFMDRQEIPRYVFDQYPRGTLSISLGMLKSFSMVTQMGHREATRFSMHRLVQLSMRKWLEENGQSNEIAAKALDLLATKFPDGTFENWKTCNELVVHAESVLRLSEHLEANLARIRLLEEVASFQNISGQYAVAEKKWREVIRLKTEMLQVDHIETLEAMESLAFILRNESRFGEADEIAKDVLKKKIALLGENSEATMKTVHLIATLLGDTGKHNEAEKMHRQNYEARLDLLGEMHPDTLKSAGKLALELWEQGRFSEAEKIARKTFEAGNVVLGEKHPDTLEIASTLGFILEWSGKLAEAEDLKQNILRMRTEIYGQNHPNTADSEHDLAWILHQMGSYKEAELHYMNALEVKTRLLGEDHPKTMTTMCNLPVFYCDNGDYKRAEDHSRNIVNRLRRKRGNDHPQVLDAMGDLAIILRHRKKLDEAAKTARIAIEGMQRVNWDNNPWTASLTCQLGHIITQRDDLTEGESIIRKALTSLKEMLEGDNPKIAIAMVCLSKNLVLQGGEERLEEGESLARQALEIRKKLLGEEHPYTFKALWQVAKVLKVRGRLEEAVRVGADANKGLRGSLDLDHPDVISCDEELRKMQQLVGTLDEDLVVVDSASLTEL